LDNSDIDAAAKKDKGVCRLFAAGEIELAVNAGVSSSMNPRPILTGMQMCGLTSNDSTSGAYWGLLAKSAGAKFADYRDWNKPYISSMPGIGDDALWDENMGTVLVAKGSRVFGLRLAVKQAPVSSRRDRSGYSRKTAEHLARKALRRL